MAELIHVPPTSLRYHPDCLTNGSLWNDLRINFQRLYIELGHRPLVIDDLVITNTWVINAAIHLGHESIEVIIDGNNYDPSPSDFT